MEIRRHNDDGTISGGEECVTLMIGLDPVLLLDHWLKMAGRVLGLKYSASMARIC